MIISQLFFLNVSTSCRSNDLGIYSKKTKTPQRGAGAVYHSIHRLHCTYWVRFPIGAKIILYLKCKALQCSTTTTFNDRLVLLLNFIAWCSSIASALSFKGGLMAKEIKNILTALSGAGGLTAMGYALMQSSLTAMAGTIALGFGLLLSALLGVVGLVSLLG